MSRVFLRLRANKATVEDLKMQHVAVRFSLTSMHIKKLEFSNSSNLFFSESLPLKRQGWSPADLLAVQCVVRSSSGCQWLWFSRLQSRRWTYPPRNPAPSLQTERCLETTSRLSLQMHSLPLKQGLPHWKSNYLSTLIYPLTCCSTLGLESLKKSKGYELFI